MRTQAADALLHAQKAKGLLKGVCPLLNIKHLFYNSHQVTVLLTPPTSASHSDDHQTLLHVHHCTRCHDLVGRFSSHKRKSSPLPRRHICHPAGCGLQIELCCCDHAASMFVNTTNTVCWCYAAFTGCQLPSGPARCQHQQCGPELRMPGCQQQ